MLREIASPGLRVQAKLAVGAVDDPFEHEADRVADRVMRMSTPALAALRDLAPALPAVAQRACCASCGQAGECGEPVTERVTRTANGTGAGGRESAGFAAPPLVSDVIASPGRPLDARTRAFMEPRFGRDFTQVRVHTGARAAESARAVRSLAYTAGRNIVFDDGRYAPDDHAGRALLAHELAHVVQQDASSTTVRRSVATPGAEPGESPQPPGEMPAPPSETPAPATEGPANPKPVPKPETCPPPADMACTAASSTPGNVTDTIVFPADSALLTTRQRAEIDATAAGSLAAGATRIRVDGYASAEYECAYNWRLSCRRAQAVVAELTTPSDGSAGIPAANIEMFAHGESDEAGPALAPNRRATISVPMPLPEPQPEPAPARNCGPDVTAWLRAQMSANYNHPSIVTMREHRWPRWIPVFNIGWTLAAAADFASLVGGGKIWDFKAHQGARGGPWRERPGAPCPSHACDRTVTLCGHCVDYDVPGNIHFGYIGRAAELSPWFLHRGADAAQHGQLFDDPWDAVAIDVGIDIIDAGTDLCAGVDAHLADLNVQRGIGCSLCGTAPP